MLATDIFNVQTTELLVLNIFDMSGKMVFNFSGTMPNILNYFKSRGQHLLPSLYLAQVTSDSGKLCFSKKIFITN